MAQQREHPSAGPIGGAFDETERLVQIRNQRRSALARAVDLHKQLEEKTRELANAASTEEMEASARIEALTSGTTRAALRCRALDTNLVTVRAEVSALRRRKTQLHRLLAARRREANFDERQTLQTRVAQLDTNHNRCKEDYEEPTEAARMQRSRGGMTNLLRQHEFAEDKAVQEVVSAFVDGTLSLFGDHFVRPVCAHLDAQEARLNRVSRAVSQLTPGSGGRTDAVLGVEAAAPLRAVQGESANEDRHSTAFGTAVRLLQTYAALLAEEERLGVAGERRHVNLQQQRWLKKSFADLWVAAAEWRARLDTEAAPK